ncbi:MAG: glycosyltransferase family 1 protein [Acidimicrobiales bacterium]
MSRIVLDARLESGRAGGLEQAIQGLVAGLSQTREVDGDEIVVVGWTGLDSWIEPSARGPGMRVEHVPGPVAGRAARLLRGNAVGRAVLPSLATMRARADHGPPNGSPLEAFEPDVIHFAHQRGEITRYPSVYEPWDLQHLHFPEHFSSAEYSRRDRWYRALCDDAAMVVVHCDAVRRDLTRWGIADERIAVVPMASVLSLRPALDPDEAGRRRERFALPPRYALFPAQSWPHKNHLRLVRALKLLRGRGVGIDVVCPGATRSNVATIRAAAVEAGVADLVHFPGHVPTDDLRAMYEGAALMVFPSLHEGFGLPIIEALDVGLPVVCSRIGPLVEVAAGAARYFDPMSSESIADALVSVWSDDDAAERLARFARKRAAQFSWAATARAYRSLYKRVVNVGSPV